LNVFPGYILEGCPSGLDAEVDSGVTLHWEAVTGADNCHVSLKEREYTDPVFSITFGLKNESIYPPG
jgi:hypothetical protein